MYQRHRVMVVVVALLCWQMGQMAQTIQSQLVMNGGECVCACVSTFHCSTAAYCTQSLCLSVSTHHLHHLEDQANLTALALVGGECKMHSCHTLGAFSAHLHWLLLPFGGEYSYIDSSFSSESSTTLRHQSSAQQKALAESA